MSTAQQAWPRRFLGATGGNLTIEVALMAPIFLLVTAYLVDYGRALEVRRNLTAAAQAAAEYSFELGKVTGNETAIATFAKNAAGNGQGLTSSVTQACECPNGSSVSCSLTCSGVQPNKYAVVSLNQPINPIAWWPAWNGSKTLAGKMQVRLP